MALEICSCGVGQLPPFTPSGAAQALVASGRARLESEVRGRASAALAPVRQEIQAQVSAAVAPTRAAIQAEASKVFRSMGLPPNLPVAIPTSPTVEGVKDAAYATGKQYAEKLIQEKTGFPFKLPRKLNATEIGKSIGAVFPTDVQSAMNTALAVGAQAATSALTSMLVGATVGSVVPGLGTVIGIGVAIGVNALRNLVRQSPVYKALVSVAKYTPIGLSITVAGKILKPFSKLFGEKPPPSQVKCKTPWVCPTLPEGVDSLGLIIWTTRQLDSPAARALRQEIGGRIDPTSRILQARDIRCGVGEAVACASFLRQLRGEAISFSIGTPATMGLPVVTATFNDLSALPENLDLYGNWKRFGDFPELMRQLQSRKAELEKFFATASRVSTMTLAEIASFRFQVVTELTKAAVAVQNAQTAQAQAWLAEVAKIFSAVETRRNALQQAMHAKQEERRKIGEARIKADPRGAAIATARAGCIIGHQPSCEELRKLQGAAPSPSPPAPPRPALPATPRPAGVDQARAFCQKLLVDWERANASQARCLTAADRARVLALCYEAHGTRRITVAESLKQISDVVRAACARAAPASVPRVPGVFSRPVLAPRTAAAELVRFVR